MVFRCGIYIALSLLCVTLPCFSQQEAVDLEELLMEALPEELSEDVDMSEVIDRLLDYQKKPLNLNTADEKQLADLVFLSPKQIESLLYHRMIAGEFLSILELQGIRDLDFQTIQLLRLFVDVKPPVLWKNLKTKDVWKEADQMILLRYGRMIEKQQGYMIEDENRSRYLGDPNRYSVRYRLNYDSRIRLSLNMEKDVGEPFFREKQRLGFDFYSGHLAVQEINRHVKQIVVGDYALQFGQGLILWNGLSFGKSAWISSAARQGRGLVPYSSMNESNFHRGISGTFALGQFEVTPFVSYNRLSGKVEPSEEGGATITTINYSGLHRTPTEQSYRKAIGQLNYGTNIAYSYQRLKVGLTYLSTSFTGTVERGTNLYQQFDFEGKSLQQLGLHYNYTYRNLYLFGEAAKSFGGGSAVNSGILASLHPKLSAVVHYRNYARDYRQFYARSLGEGSQVGNEKGVYSGLVYHPSRKIEWVAYMDVFHFPWLRYRVDAPSQGTDFLTQFTYSWYKKGAIKVRYRQRLRQENLLPDTRHENLLADVVRNQLRLEFQYKWSDTWSTRSRLEGSRYDKEQEENARGWLIYQDVAWRGLRGKVQSNVRMAFFDTQGYNARIYAYESNVLYASGFPMYYDKGIRAYWNVRWRLLRKMDLWARYAITKYADKEEIGSGLDRIDGDKRSDITIQLRWQW